MKKRVLSIFLIAVMLIGLLSTVSFASEILDSGSCGSLLSDLTWTLYKNGLLTITGTGSMIDYGTTSSVPWAENRSHITDVSISEGVTYISTYAFVYCSELSTVTIPNSVSRIGCSAFSGCKKLSTVIVGKGLTGISEDAFYRCNSLTGVYFKGDAPSLSFNVFTTNDEETGGRITIPGLTLYYVEGKAGWTTPTWNGYPTATWVPEESDTPDEPENPEEPPVEIIATGSCGDDLIYTFSSDGLLTITGTGDMYPYFSFSEYFENRITKLKLDNRMTSICEQAFLGCTELDEVKLPAALTSIGDSAFSACEKLTEITVPAGVNYIGKSAFYMCSNLKAVYFCGDAPELGDNVFKTFKYASNVNIPGLTLYYIEGKNGWTSPEWNGYPTATWIPITFSDVKESDWYYDAVKYVVNNGLMNGMGNNEFQPNAPMTRAMLVTVLWRYVGEPMEGENIFADVPEGTWYTDAVAWAAENGIVNGTSPTTFDPEGYITREQIATILYRYCSQQGIDTSKRADLSIFPDGDMTSNYALETLSWANAEGLINGTKVGSTVYLDPQGNATRAQVATILMRFIENIAG